MYVLGAPASLQNPLDVHRSRDPVRLLAPSGHRSSDLFCPRQLDTTRSAACSATWLLCCRTVTCTAGLCLRTVIEAPLTSGIDTKGPGKGLVGHTKDDYADVQMRPCVGLCRRGSPHRM